MREGTQREARARAAVGRLSRAEDVLNARGGLCLVARDGSGVIGERLSPFHRRCRAACRVHGVLFCRVDGSEETFEVRDGALDDAASLGERCAGRCVLPAPGSERPRPDVETSATCSLRYAGAREPSRQGRRRRWRRSTSCRSGTPPWHTSARGNAPNSRCRRAGMGSGRSRCGSRPRRAPESICSRCVRILH